MEKSGYGVRETGSLKSDLQLSYMCHIVSGILGYAKYPFMLFDDTLFYSELIWLDTTELERILIDKSLWGNIIYVGVHPQV